MILTRTGNRTVTGLPDWEVEEHFPSYVEYRADGRAVQFSAELSSQSGSIIVYHYPHATYWQPPHRGEPLTPEEVRPCLVRVTAAVLLLGVKPIWETDPVGAERNDWPVIMMEVQALLRRAD